MSKLQFTKTAYTKLEDFVFGKSLHPIKLKNGMVIGGGTVYPEINFTLPTMMITKATMPEVIANYKQITEGICQRARELQCPGFVAEIELLPPMTFTPEWGTEVTKTVLDIIKENATKYGLKGAVRLTPNDIREGSELQHYWRGRHWDAMLESFTQGAKAGAEFLAIESVGGKEVHDEAVMYCDIAKSVFALSVLGATDMEKLWSEIVRIGNAHGSIASGDTACGFGNTAMVLADRNFIPKVFAATVRVATVARSLVALECGAKGPHKDCGYEGIYIKAITGTPIAMEGASAACAHLSPIGNVASCVTDLWSNESVQNIKLLGGMAPTVSFEQLTYDCRRMNTATEMGAKAALLLRDMHADSDSKLDPQAYVLRPDVALEISKELVKVKTPYERTVLGAKLALEHMRKAVQAKKLDLPEKEKEWLATLSKDVDALPKTPEELTASVAPDCEKLDLKKYDM